jgi:hypothetical protein
LSLSDSLGLFPHLEMAPASGYFNWDFGRAELPREAGIKLQFFLLLRTFTRVPAGAFFFDLV